MYYSWAICNYLALNCARGESAIVLSRVLEVTVNVSVRNIGENAYLARLVTTFEQVITFIVVTRVSFSYTCPEV